MFQGIGLVNVPKGIMYWDRASRRAVNYLLVELESRFEISSNNAQYTCQLDQCSRIVITIGRSHSFATRLEILWTIGFTM